MSEAIGTAGEPTSDAHLAAAAIDCQAELHSTDADCGRFSGLRRRNPQRRGQPAPTAAGGSYPA